MMTVTKLVVKLTRVAAFALALPWAFSATAESPQPNILLIMCDDLGYADVGFSGAPDIRTPELDALAKAGTICTSGYVVHPFCGPSRMGLMSGRYPHAYGGPYNLPPLDAGIEEYNKLGIAESETLISTVLQEAGYYTGIIGKWHMGEEAAYHPNNRGFDDFYGFLGGGHHYFPDHYLPAYERQIKAGKKNIKDYLLPLEHNGHRTKEDEYLTDALSKQAVRFITEAAGTSKPFFLYLSYNAPHSPMEAKEEDMAAYSNITNKKRRIVAGMVAAVDRGVGLVTDALKEHGQFDNTLIIFLSDNGGKPDLGSSNAPFRGTKGDTWEGGSRVPMFFHWPNNIPAQTFDHPVSALDFYPTFAALANADIPEGKILDGKDILTNLKNGTDSREGEAMFFMRHRGGFSDVGARRDEWKIVRMYKQPWRLFNIVEDPSENEDLASRHPEHVTELVKSAEMWSRTHTEPLWFDSIAARNEWNKGDQLNFDKVFEVVTGAPPLRPIVHATDDPFSASAPDAAVPSAEPAVRLKRGDSTKADYIAREKLKWEQNRWKWDQSKVEANFDMIDTNNDGVASGEEKKAYWEKAD